MQVNVICRFQYRLSSNVADLITLFRDWGEDYESTFVLLARNILRDAMSEFEVNFHTNNLIGSTSVLLQNPSGGKNEKLPQRETLLVLRHC